MSDDDMVTITVRRDDLESAIDAIGYAHSDYCVSFRSCTCDDEAERLREALEAAATD